MYCSPALCYLPSFPTRRSSDLHRVRREQTSPRRRQLDRQWQAIQPNADLGYGRRILIRHREVRLDGDESECADRKSTRLNSSHVAISYAVFCLKKKKSTTKLTI